MNARFLQLLPLMLAVIRHGFRKEKPEERLIAAYTEASAKLLREIKSFSKPTDQTRILQRINAILNQLERLTADYISTDLPERFKDGSAMALYELRKLRIPDLDGTFAPLHLEAVKSLAEDARLRFGEAIKAVKSSAAVALSRAKKEAILQKILVQEVAGGTNPTNAVKQLLEGWGVQRMQGQRTWNLDDYADMLVRTTVGEAHNTGAAMRYVANDVQYAEVVERDTACPICQPMDGKIVWLGDPRLRPVYHPRCRGAIIPIQGTPENPIMSIDDKRIPQKTREAMLKK